MCTAGVGAILQLGAVLAGAAGGTAAGDALDDDISNNASEILLTRPTMHTYRMYSAVVSSLMLEICLYICLLLHMAMRSLLQSTKFHLAAPPFFLRC